MLLIKHRVVALYQPNEYQNDIEYNGNKKIAPALRTVNLNRKAYTIPLLFRIFAPNILES